MALLLGEDKGVVYFIRGPLGIWPFPMLNTLVLIVQLVVGARYVTPVEEKKPKAKTYNIVRDEHGRITAIEEIYIE
jgi:hypothetical protein